MATRTRASERYALLAAGLAVLPLAFVGAKVGNFYPSTAIKASPEEILPEKSTPSERAARRHAFEIKEREAYAHFMSKRYAEAFRSAKAAANMKVYSSSLENLLGCLYHGNGKFDEACAHFNRAISHNPGASIKINRATSLLAMARWKAAAADLSDAAQAEVAQMQPYKKEQTIYLLTIAHIKAGDNAAAIEVIRANPRDSDSGFSVGMRCLLAIATRDTNLMTQSRRILDYCEIPGDTFYNSTLAAYGLCAIPDPIPEIE